MRSKSIATTTVALAALLLAGPALAHRTPLSIALKKAYELWKVKPCEGHYTVQLHVGELPLPDNLREARETEIMFAPTVEGEATWQSPSGPDVFGSPPSEWTGCTMILPVSKWRTRALRSDWPEACLTVLHEWGHLTGHPHSGEYSEPPGTTAEQLAVMKPEGGSDLRRCGRRVPKIRRPVRPPGG